MYRLNPGTDAAVKNGCICGPQNDPRRWSIQPDCLQHGYTCADRFFVMPTYQTPERKDADATIRAKKLLEADRVRNFLARMGSGVGEV